MANKQGGRRRHSGHNHKTMHSGEKHHQAKRRRGQDRTYPWRPWQLDGVPDNPVWAARAAVQNSDLLTERFKKGA